MGKTTTSTKEQYTIQNVGATEGKLCPECKSKETINYTVNEKELWKCFDCGNDFVGRSEQLVCESCKQKFTPIDKWNFHCQECQPCKPLKAN